MASCLVWATSLLWLSAVVASTMNGTATRNTTEAAPMTITVTLTTAERASHASSSARVVRRCTNTGMNVADRMPPRTMSWTMLGMVLARL